MDSGGGRRVLLHKDRRGVLVTAVSQVEAAMTFRRRVGDFGYALLDCLPFLVFVAVGLLIAELR